MHLLIYPNFRMQFCTDEGLWFFFCPSSFTVESHIKGSDHDAEEGR